MEEYYSAEVTQLDSPLPSGYGQRHHVKCVASWGFDVDVSKHGGVFTTKVANELLNLANKAYKQRFGKEVDFNYIKVDLSGIGKRIRGTYDKQKNILEIYSNDVLIYANCDGEIYRA